MAGVSGLAIANHGIVPEISPGSAGTALALLSGILLVMGSRKK